MLKSRTVTRIPIRQFSCSGPSKCAGTLHSSTLDPHQPSPLTRFTVKNTSTSRVQQVTRHFFSSHPSSKAKMSSSGGYSVRKNGAPNTLEHRIYIEKDGVPVSPFHDIPLYANEQQTVLNMIVEIPRWTNAKMEVNYTTRLFCGGLSMAHTVCRNFVWLIFGSDLQGGTLEPNQTRY